AAEHRFERRRGLPAWDLHADDFDVEISENGLDYMPSHSATPLSLEAVLRGRRPQRHQAESSMLDLVEPVSAGAQRLDGRPLTPRDEAGEDETGTRHRGDVSSTAMFRQEDSQLTPSP